MARLNYFRKPTYEKIEAMWELFLEHKTPKQISQELGISVLTVRRYIRHGDSDRKILPFEQREREVFAASQILSDEELIKRKAGHLQALTGTVAKTLTRYTKRLKNSEEAEEAARLGNLDLAHALMPFCHEPNAREATELLRLHQEALDFSGSARAEEEAGGGRSPMDSLGSISKEDAVSILAEMRLDDDKLKFSDRVTEKMAMKIAAIDAEELDDSETGETQRKNDDMLKEDDSDLPPDDREL